MLDDSESVVSPRSGRSRRFPVMFVFEATGSIIEYLKARFPDAARAIPADPAVAAEVRIRDANFRRHVCDAYDDRRGVAGLRVIKPSPGEDAWGGAQRRSRDGRRCLLASRGGALLSGEIDGPGRIDVSY
jgi:hypothetical protein